jgi:D-alanyl-D-alanine carboxypeptidase/D-alanyl-D-alanine-endopeptidase (penicillin-binding protein 4)
MMRRVVRRIMRRYGAIVLFTLSAVIGTVLGLAATRLASHVGERLQLPARVVALFSPGPAARIGPSLRRFPVILPMHPDTSRVRAVLAPIFSGNVFSRAGIAVVAQDGTLLYGKNAEKGLAPASTMKLLVASTALNMLGPKYRFETAFVAEAKPKAGVISGPLWFVGSGDPLFTKEDLQGGVAMLAHAGVRRINGDIVVDDSAFRGPERNPKWDVEDLQYGFAAGASAVSLDQGTAELDVVPGLPGNPARIRVVPPNRDVRVVGEIESVLRGDGTLVHIRLKPDVGVSTEPSNVFEADGRVEVGQTQVFWEPVHNLARYAGYALLSMLQERAITVAGSVRIDRAPLAARTLWQHRSQPLDAILRDMLTTSNNHTAEQLLRVVGAQERHVGTLQTGAAAEKSALKLMNIPTTGLRIVDGSGLSPSNRVAAVTLARLTAAELQTPAGERFLRGLPRVGIEGTVRYHRLHRALGKARAKSGHIEGVNALAGTVQTAKHGRVAFAIIVNDPRAYGDEVTSGQDRMLDALAGL